jgi:hypothetical protein
LLLGCDGNDTVRHVEQGREFWWSHTRLLNLSSERAFHKALAPIWFRLVSSVFAQTEVGENGLEADVVGAETTSAAHLVYWPDWSPSPKCRDIWFLTLFSFSRLKTAN